MTTMSEESRYRRSSKAARRSRALELLLPVGRFSRTQFALTMLGAGAATAVVWLAVPQIYVAWSFILLWVVFVASARRLHDRNHSAFFFLLVLVPVANLGGFLYLLLAPSSAVDPLERQKCLEYFAAEAKLRIFQEREAERYDEALQEHLERVATHRTSAERLEEAGRRIRAAVREIWRRRANELGGIPDRAMPLYLRWQERYEAYDAWAEATALATEEMAEGAAPPGSRLRSLEVATQKAYNEALQEERRFLKEVRLDTDAVHRMVIEPLLEEEESEDWLPRRSG